MAFNRFRPTSHFIAPHSWANDPCGAIYVPETKEYIVCYQWNPGTPDGGNCAWGMAKSRDLATWEDCPPALMNGTTYDRLGVFSGSIVSKMVEETRILFLFYTSISAMPIHWSKPYIKGCETQAVAFSADLGKSWQRYKNNPLLRSPPLAAVTGWRDPFVSPWPALSGLLGLPTSTDYMLLSSGERGQGPQLHIYQSNNLLDWNFLSTILSCKAGAKVSPKSKLIWALNFECGSFFTFGKKHYMIVGFEEDNTSKNHNHRSLHWLGGDLILENGKPKFVITTHGLLDQGILYAAHIFRDAEGRLLQLGWADEAAKHAVILKQNWAGCLAHPRQLFMLSRPITENASNSNIWDVDEENGIMTTLGVRPAPQISTLRRHSNSKSLKEINHIQSLTYEIEATFHSIKGTEKFIFSIRQSPESTEVTCIIFDLSAHLISVDRSHSSLEEFGSNSIDSGDFEILPKEDLRIDIHVDNSIVEVYANDRFALTSRVYPSLKTSVGASYDFAGFEEEKVEVRLWDGLKNAWPKRVENHENFLGLDDAVASATNEKIALVERELLNKMALPS